MKIKYYLTNDANGELVFDCYHSAVNGAGGSYSALNSVKGTISSASGTNADTCVEITWGDVVTITTGSTITVQFSIHYNDWKNLDTTNDYSALDANNIVVMSGDSIVLGKEP